LDREQEETGLKALVQRELKEARSDFERQKDELQTSARIAAEECALMRKELEVCSSVFAKECGVVAQCARTGSSRRCSIGRK
jgi:hypothetical protein